MARAAAEPAALAAIYDFYFPRVYNYLRYRVGSAEAADDLTAQVFERVLANLHRYRPEDFDSLEAFFRQQMGAGRAWRFSFEGHKWGGCCADGMVNEAVQLLQAVAQAGYALRLPGYLPAGYSPLEVRRLGLARHDVFVTYAGPAGSSDIGLYQTFSGFQAERQEGPATVVDARSVAAITDGTVERARVGEVPAALLEDEALIWEEEGVTYQLVAPGLEPDAIVRIAESLEAVR